jgi:hypothetical protein
MFANSFPVSRLDTDPHTSSCRVVAVPRVPLIQNDSMSSYEYRANANHGVLRPDYQRSWTESKLLVRQVRKFPTE